MNRSDNRILTTHAGRLAGGRELTQRRRESGDSFKEWVRGEMSDAVKRQVDMGLDVISDGEFGKFGGFDYYGKRMAGVSQRPVQPGEPAIMSQATNERLAFAAFYASMAQGAAGTTPEDRLRATSQGPQRMICNGPLSYTGQAEVASDLQMFQSALQGAGAGETFMCVLAPGWIEHSLYNEYYKTDEEFLFGIAEAMAPEYKAIVDAGHILQLDDPGLPDTYDMIVPAPSIEDYRKFAEIRVDAMNHALRGLPEDRIRYHICWGSWHGPHSYDLELKHVVDLMLKVNAQAYSVEAANPRHEHEWKVWKDTKLPDGKILIPGVVSHASNVVEHPELVADRTVQYAELVGRENVIAGTDCGMGGRVHMQIGWAKLESLVKGAEMASRQLWGVRRGPGARG